MGTEIERKFLVTDGSWREGAEGIAYRQGYMATGPPVAVRARIMGAKAVITIKKATVDIARDEFEYAIPLADAEAILARLCTGHIIEKTRYKVPFDGLVWEVDVFEGANAGLIVAEVELEDVAQFFGKPPWAGEEVSHDPRYLNSNLSKRPYTDW